MMSPISLLVACSVLFNLEVAAQSPCNYRQYIEPGRSFTLANPGYPGSYGAYATCRWEAYTNQGAVVEANCYRMELAKNYWGYCLDYLMVTTNGVTTPYCQPFKVSANNVVMTLRGTTASGGLFQCTFSALALSTPAPPTQPPISCDCGWNRLAPRRRVVGGRETYVNEFPSMAVFVNVVYRSMWCGATIISPYVALTAAHCVDGQNPAEFGLLVGEHDISRGSETNETQLLKVSRFIKHQGYNANTQANDIALAITATPIVYTDNVGPACLPFLYENSLYRTVTVAGWGLDGFGGSPSNVLMKADLKIVPDSTCANAYGSYFPAMQICTYEQGKDACQFDSGGPLYDYNTKKKQFVVGVISHGKDCGASDPAVNTRVTSYIDWIRSQVPSETFCRMS